MKRMTFVSSLMRAARMATLTLAFGSIPALGVASPKVVQLQGDFTIQQQSNGRFMDAHEGSHDNSVVTRDFQANDTQKWIFEEVGRDV